MSRVIFSVSCAVPYQDRKDEYRQVEEGEVGELVGSLVTLPANIDIIEMSNGDRVTVFRAQLTFERDIADRIRDVERQLGQLHRLKEILGQ